MAAILLEINVNDLNNVVASQDFIIFKIGKIGNYANYLGCAFSLLQMTFARSAKFAGYCFSE